MNMLAQFSENQKRMSHREISGLTGKEAFHVKRDCEVMFCELGLDPEGYIQNWIHPQNGQTYTEYMLTRDLVETLITGYSIKLRHAVVNRLRELESQVNLPSYAIEDPIERAKKWIEEEKQKQAVIHQLEIAAPKAQALDVLSNSHGTETVDNCAHAMGIQPRKTLRPWMEKNNWIHKDKDGQWRAKSDRIMAGHLKEASRVITDTSGKPRHKVTVYVTPKGKALLTTRLIQAGIIKGVAA